MCLRQKIATALSRFGVVPNKSCTAKVIGLEDDPHFWRGLVDGDGFVSTRIDRPNDKQAHPVIGLSGSPAITNQFSDFCKANVGFSGAPHPQGKICHVVLKYHKAASLVRLLYGSATVSLDRKMETAKAIIAMPRYAPGKNRFRFLTCNGETLQLCEWARRTGIPLHTIMSRLKSGWLVERTLTPGIDGRNNLVSFRGQELPLSEWATLYGLTLSQLSSRIHKCNWPFEKALTTPVSPSAATRHGLTSSHSSR